MDTPFIALMVSLGLMSLAWIAVLALVVLAQKAAPFGERSPRFLAVALATAAVVCGSDSVAIIRATRPVASEDDVRCGIPGYEEAAKELYADEPAVHDDPFDFALTGKCAYRSAFHYAS